MMMIDAFQTEGITELAVDSIFMMPHLGVLSTVHPDAATEVFEKDCLIRLGTCIAPVGNLPRRKLDLCEIDVAAPGGERVRETLKRNDVRFVPLGAPPHAATSWSDLLAGIPIQETQHDA